MVDGRPTWHHRCEQCFACLQWCPEEAIQFGTETAGKDRYHHPDVTLADMRRAASKEGQEHG
jgi:MinD superfamily P-loop ATPase